MRWIPGVCTADVEAAAHESSQRPRPVVRANPGRIAQHDVEAGERRVRKMNREAEEGPLILRVYLPRNLMKLLCMLGDNLQLPARGTRLGSHRSEQILLKSLCTQLGGSMLDTTLLGANPRTRQPLLRTTKRALQGRPLGRLGMHIRGGCRSKLRNASPHLAAGSASAQIERINQRISLPDLAIQIGQCLDMAVFRAWNQREPKTQSAEKRSVALQVDAVKRSCNHVAPKLHHTALLAEGATLRDAGQRAEQERTGSACGI